MILSIKRPFSACRHNGTASRWSRMIGHPLDEARWAEVALRALTLVGLVVLPTLVHAGGLECPDVGRGAIPALTGDAQIGRMTTGNNTDLATEIGGLIGRLRAENPTVSDTEITNILIAAYCPVVAQKRPRHREVGAHAAVRSGADAAARGHRDAAGFADHRQYSAATSSLPKPDQPSRGPRSTRRGLHGRHPDPCGWTVIIEVSAP